jgi:hypothetical protein
MYRLYLKCQLIRKYRKNQTSQPYLKYHSLLKSLMNRMILSCLKYLMNRMSL